MNGAKIRLSPPEMELVTNADIILTKNAILKKAMQLLGGLQEKQQAFLGNAILTLPAEIINASPKISRGENYRGLPYLVLDFPRSFDKEDIFVIRSMFWWGHFFSTTLHLSGRYRELFARKIIQAENILRDHDYYCCVNEDPWQHHFGEDNYVALKSLDQHAFHDMIGNKPFVKLSRKLPLSMWETADESLCRNFEQLICLLAD